MTTTGPEITPADIRLGAVHYDAQKGMYEARVDVRRGERTYRYPCQVTAPADMDSGWIASRLTQQALRQSDTPTLN